jgi:hypothetical protein
VTRAVKRTVFDQTRSTCFGKVVGAGTRGSEREAAVLSGNRKVSRQAAGRRQFLGVSWAPGIHGTWEGGWH